MTPPLPRSQHAADSNPAVKEAEPGPTAGSGKRKAAGLLLLSAVVLGAGLLLTITTFRSSVESERSMYVVAKRERTQQVADDVEGVFRAMYESLRTIARLPGVKKIDRYAKNFDSDARRTVQEIYNNLAASVSVSEVYIVPLDMDPDQPDAVTGKMQEPITTFDELIVGRTAGSEDQPGGGEGVGEQKKVEEIEIYEYRLMKQQLAWMRSHAPDEAALSGGGMHYPALCGPEVITCDNSRYSPDHPDDKDRSGLVYSVPFYDGAGKLKGCISAVILTHAIEELLGNESIAVLRPGAGYTVNSPLGCADQVRASASFVAAMQPDPSLVFSMVSGLKIVDETDGWMIWAGSPNGEFYSRPGVRSAYRAGGLGLGAAVGAAVAIFMAARAARRRVLAAAARAEELNRLVEERTSELSAVTVELRSAKEAAEAALRDVGALRHALDHHAIVAVTDPSGRIIDVNEHFCRISGYSREELIGQTHRIINSGVHPRDFWPEVWRTIANGKAWSGEVCNRAKSGSLYWVDTTIMPFKDAAGRIVKHVAIRVDITARKRAEDELRRSALLDRLTGLPNRALLADRLGQCVRRAQRHPDRKFAVLFLDFDRFKLVNDSLGHEAGDALLREIAARLRSVLRPADTLSREIEGLTAARLGGDEFVVILDEITRAEDAVLVADRLLEAFSAPYRLGGNEVVSTASIGIVTSDLAQGEAEDILRDADTAMYEAKLAGRGRYVVFDVGMRERVQRRVMLESDLRKAVEQEQFDVAYQPIVHLETGRLVGMEALARWNHPQRGVVSPAEFIPVAEETGLIIKIGEWVLHEACVRLAQWRRELPGIESLSVSVNLSRAQLAMDDLPARVEAILQRTGLPASSLRLEVTENQVVGARGDLSQALQRLKSLGVTLAMDDFGTGLSSLSGLHQLPFDVIKIDRSFVTNIARGRHFMALAQSVVSLAGNLGLTTVAEGIETQQQVSALQGLGCDFGQGYYFAKPMTADQMRSYMRGVQKGRAKAA